MPMPVTHSILDATAIGELVADRYDIGDVVSAELYRSWANEVYQITTGGNESFFLKLARRSWRTEEDVRWEVRLQEHLLDHGIPVARPIRQITGEPIVLMDAPEGERAGVLYAETPGIKPQPPHSPQLYEAFGESSARMHEAMDRFTMPSPRPAHTIDWLVHRSAKIIESAIPTEQETRTSVREIANWLGAELQARSRDLEFGVCHGDLTLDNLTITPNRTITFFDFDLSAVGYRAAEHAGLYGWMLTDEVAKPFWAAFLDGYRSVRAFCQAEEESMPFHLAAYQLHDLSHEIENWRSWSGLWRMPEKEIVAHIERLRTWQADLSKLATRG